MEHCASHSSGLDLDPSRRDADCRLLVLDLAPPDLITDAPLRVSTLANAEAACAGSAFYVNTMSRFLSKLSGRCRIMDFCQSIGGINGIASRGAMASLISR